MEAFLIYLGKVALAMGAFYLTFLILFQKQKQFSFNRIYLLATMVISYIIPLITFTIIKQIEALPVQTFTDYNYLETYVPIAVAIEKSYEWYHYLFVLLIAGAAGFTINFLIGNFKALNIIRKSYKKEEFGSGVCITDEDVHPFSFFNKVIISQKTLPHPNLPLILAHENLHIKERHTYDILLAEILFLLEWFNPFAWLLKDAVKNNLEYITDDFITKQNDRETYQLAMVSLADKKGVAPFLTALNGSQLKNRIVMMKKKTTNRFTIVKQLILLPVLALLIMGLSNREIKTEIVQNETSIVKGKVTNENGEPLAWATIKIKGEDYGVFTDQKGKYAINLDEDNPTLIFSYLDISKKEITVGRKKKLNVQLNDREETKRVYRPFEGNPFDSSFRLQNSNGEMVKPLFIIDGKEVEDFETPLPGEMLGHSIVYDNLAAKYYGEKGKNGAVLISTKNWKFPPDAKPLIIVDGKEYFGSLKNIPKDSILQITELRYPNRTSEYGEKGKDGVIEIETLRMKAVTLHNHNEKKELDQSWSYSEQTDLNAIEELFQKEINENGKNETIVKGKVTNEKGEPFVAAMIIEYDTSGKELSGCTTDGNGKFIYEIQNESSVIKCSARGYKTLVLEIKENEEINIQLEKDEQSGLNRENIKKELQKINGSDFPVEIKGKITNEKGDPIPFASVLILGKPIGTMADHEGNYVIKVTDNDAVLNIRLRGWESKQIRVGEQREINVELKEGKQSGLTREKINTELNKINGSDFPIEVKGKVTNSEGKVIPYASVLIKGKTIGTITGQDGNYIIKVPDNDVVLIYGLPGLESKEIKVGEKREINVTLERKDIEVTGYKNPASLLKTNSAISLRSNRIELSGNGDDNPLYILDGKEVESIESIPPSTIHSISVLKDASAAAVYGTKGKNGVVIITTKEGYYLSQLETNEPDRNENPLIVIDGKETDKTIEDLIEANQIESMNVLKGESAKEKYGEKGEDGVIEIITIGSNNSDRKDPDKVHYLFEEMPEFPGGEKALREFIAKKIKYPKIAKEKGIEGKVYITFVVDKKGNIKDSWIIRGVDPSLDKEALRIINSFPKWKPGKYKGKAVDASYTVPITFSLNGEYIETGTSRIYSSVNGKKPLLIVDGIPQENFKGIKPDIILSEQFIDPETPLKKYGEDGKNGVILVTTKNSEFTNTSEKELSKFLILIESSDNKVKLTGLKGCAFKELSFTLNTNDFQAINQYGTMPLKKVSPNESNKLADFQFIIRKTEEGLSFNAITGTTWKLITFYQDIKNSQYINQNGMVKIQ